MIKVRHNDRIIKTRVRDTIIPAATHTVPCGKCAFCLMNKRSQWMFRIHFEMKNQLNPGWFVTLTYNEKYVKRTADGRLSLRFRDVQLFLKKLRKAKYEAKYVCVGEYGGETKRPHYHMLLWTDCPGVQLENYWTTRKGELLGQIHLGRITMASAMYTLKYIIQPKQRDVDGLEKTRAQFSKGIGLSYLSSAVYYYHTADYDAPVMTSRIDGKQIALPRYYKTKIFDKYQTKWEGTKNALRAHTEKRKTRKRLRDQGIQKVDEYMHNLRVEVANRIIAKTKYKQTL